MVVRLALTGKRSFLARDGVEERSPRAIRCCFARASFETAADDRVAQGPPRLWRRPDFLTVDGGGDPARTRRSAKRRCSMNLGSLSLRRSARSVHFRTTTMTTPSVATSVGARRLAAAIGAQAPRNRIVQRVFERGDHVRRVAGQHYPRRPATCLGDLPFLLRAAARLVAPVRHPAVDSAVLHGVAVRVRGFSAASSGSPPRSRPRRSTRRMPVDRRKPPRRSEQYDVVICANRGAERPR